MRENILKDERQVKIFTHAMRFLLQYLCGLLISSKLSECALGENGKANFVSICANQSNSKCGFWSGWVKKETFFRLIAIKCNLSEKANQTDAPKSSFDS